MSESYYCILRMCLCRVFVARAFVCVRAYTTGHGLSETVCENMRFVSHSGDRSQHTTSKSVVVVLLRARSHRTRAISLAPRPVALYASIFLCPMRFGCVGARSKQIASMHREYISTTFCGDWKKCCKQSFVRVQVCVCVYACVAAVFVLCFAFESIIWFGSRSIRSFVYVRQEVSGFPII